MSSNPVRTDRLEAGILGIVRAHLPSADVGMAYQQLPDEGAELKVRARVLSSSTWNAGALLVRSFPTEVVITVGAVAEDDLASTTVSGRRYAHDVAAGESAEDVRDALLVLMGTNYTSATFAGTGTDQITITAEAPGDLYDVQALGVLSYTSTDVLCEVQYQTETTEVELQAYSKATAPSLGAHAAMTKIRNSIRGRISLSVLSEHSLVVQPGRVVDLTSISGPEWEGRSALTFSVEQVSIYAEPVETFTAAGVGISTDHGTITVEANP